VFYRILLLVTLGLFAGTISAESKGLENDKVTISHIPQKKSSFRTVFLEYYESQNADREISLINLNLEKGYYPLKPLSLNGGLHLLYAHGYRINKKDPELKKMDANTIGMGFAGTVHLDALKINIGKLFFDFRFGFLLCLNKFPPNGTFWNFTQRYGIGFSVKLKRNLDLILGGRHLHVSNGGYVRNPSYNGNGPFLGLRFGF
jgi:hypothetical protein